jgi:hypothetical protein
MAHSATLAIRVRVDRRRDQTVASAQAGLIRSDSIQSRIERVIGDRTLTAM